MSGIRALVALAVMAMLAVILCAYYIGQPHPIGSVAYNYLVAVPNFLSLLGTVGVVVVVVMVLRRRRNP